MDIVQVLAFLLSNGWKPAASSKGFRDMLWKHYLTKSKYRGYFKFTCHLCKLVFSWSGRGLMPAFCAGCLDEMKNRHRKGYRMEFPGEVPSRWAKSDEEANQICPKCSQAVGFIVPIKEKDGKLYHESCLNNPEGNNGQVPS